jgi:TolB protein
MCRATCSLIVILAATQLAASPPAGPTSTPGFSGRIVFDDWEDVYVADARGGGATRLTTTPGPELDAEWSPDGTRIVYRDSTRGFNEDDEIHIMAADGTGQTDLTDDPANDWGPTWSPDGTTIAFDSDRTGTMRLYLMDADGSDVTRLTTSPGHDGWPVWAPDGSRIAFSTRRDDCRFSDAPDCVRTGAQDPHSDVWVMRPDGTDQRRLTWSSGDFLAWTPDGTHVVFGSADGLHAVSLDGRDARIRIEGMIGDPTLLHWIP